MTKSPSVSYPETIRKSGLVPEGKLNEILSELGVAQNPQDADAAKLARRLLESKLITPWQQGMLAQGRYRGFFLGRYKLMRHLTAGISNIFLAEHAEFGRQVAIKVLPRSRVQDASHLERFVRESQLLASLDHPNIVRAYDIDVQDGNLYYMVLEYIRGVDLERIVTEKGRLHFLKAANYISQAANGLGHAHEHHLVHRDMKPSNLMLDREGVIKILDLGMARVPVDQSDEYSVTQLRNEILGTADFLSPEQVLDSHKVDHRADIYSLGCTLYFLLVGHPPFMHESLAQKLMAHHNEPPPRIQDEVAEVPPELEAIVYQMMAKSVDDRFQTMQEVKKSLDLILAFK